MTHSGLRDFLVLCTVYMVQKRGGFRHGKKGAKKCYFFAVVEAGFDGCGVEKRCDLEVRPEKLRFWRLPFRSPVQKVSSKKEKEEEG